MAKNAKLDMTVDVVNNTEAGLVEVEQSVDRTAKAMQKAGKKASKNWAGIANLFTGLLPRGMQKTIRSFKSTQRSVGRLSKSFTVLRGAMMGIVTGGLIIALEKIIENWDSILDAIKGVSAEEKRLNEQQTRHKEQTNQIVAANRAYLEVVQDINASDQERQFALQGMAKEMGVLKELDLESKTAQDEITQAYQDHIRLTKLQGDALADEELLTKKINEGKQVKNSLTFTEVTTYNNLAQSISVAYAEEWKRKTLTEKQNAAIAEQAVIVERQKATNAEIAEIEARIEETLSKQLEKKQQTQKAEADAKKVKAETDREREANAKYLADLEKRLSEEIMLAGIEDEQERQLKVLELRNEEQKKKAEDAGATTSQLLQIEQAYQLEREAVIKSFSDRQKEEDEAVRQQALADEQALEDELFMIRANGRDRELTAEQLKHEEEIMLSFDRQAQEELRAQQEFDRRIAQAGENQELIKMVEEQYQLELTEIEKNGEEERNEIVQDGVDKETKIRQAGAKAVISATQNLFGTMEALAGENEKAAQGFAITGVLLAQAVALANGIKTATQSSATVWDMIAGIVASTAAVLGAFVGVKAILNEATDGGGGNVGGGGAQPQITPLVPTGVARLDSPSGSSNQAFVVQSEIEGANLQANNMYGQTSLNPG